mmetsp:Transcript_23978/g.50370  ORF Transcript_23978/g.50370 Transcript_23978/m.50370 type:complete len:364 (-) Transcript_23978:1510-2601(-)
MFCGSSVLFLVAVPVLHVSANEPPRCRIDWLQAVQSLRRDFDRISFVWKDCNEVPDFAFGRIANSIWLAIFVVKHDAGSAEIELLHFNGAFEVHVSFFHCGIIVFLVVIHVQHPRLRNDSTNNNILRLPFHRACWGIQTLRVIFHHVVAFRRTQLQLRHHIAPQHHGSRTVANRFGTLLGATDVAPIDTQDTMPEMDAIVLSCGVLSDVSHDGASSHGINDVGWHVVEKSVFEIPCSVKHSSKALRVDASFVIFSCLWKGVLVEFNGLLFLGCTVGHVARDVSSLLNVWCTKTGGSPRIVCFVCCCGSWCRCFGHRRWCLSQRSGDWSRRTENTERVVILCRSRWDNGRSVDKTVSSEGIIAS